MVALPFRQAGQEPTAGERVVSPRQPANTNAIGRSIQPMTRTPSKCPGLAWVTLRRRAYEKEEAGDGFRKRGSAFPEMPRATIVGAEGPAPMPAALSP
jgi:hypothetical protein